MPSSRAANLAWLLQEFSDRLAGVFESMAGERPAVQQTPSANPPEGGLLWRQTFRGIAGTLWIGASEAAWTSAAERILRAAGLEDPDRETLESTYRETLGQALGGLAQAISARLGKEVTPETGEPATAPEGEVGSGKAGWGEVGWVGLELAFREGSATLYAGAESILIEALAAAEETAVVAAGEAEEAEGESEPAGPAKTFDLLLDVEMPVSVSFGRARVPLKDVLKLTTGSIVELNRSLTEPVEVIVNNCVIARGEVVVVEGNFGVRIQQVVSRRERLRTLN